jgi:hypothetical protein
MGYYIRVFSPSAECLPVPMLQNRLGDSGIAALISVVEGSGQEWDELELSHAGGEDGLIAIIERSPVEPGSLGEEEVGEFLNELEDPRPVSAAEWLREYLPSVRTIYAFQIMHSGVELGQGWDAVHALQGEIWDSLGGIFQADGEGFSNEDGYHILWQFSDDVSGPWNMAVREGNNWVAFEMDLGNRQHREAFKAGRVPDGVNRL